MAAVAASDVAVAAVYGSAVAVDAVKANETAWATLTGATSAVMGKAAAKLAGLNPADYADMAAIASSSTAMAAVIGNSAALNAVVSSQTAMAAIANNKTAITAVEASAVAKNALYNSPLKTSISNIASTSSWTTRRNGKIWLISFRQTWSSGNTSMQHRSTLKDGGTVSCTASQSYNTDYRIDRFMDSITNYNSAGGIGNVCTYYFIPC